MAMSHLPSLLFLLFSPCFLQAVTLSHHRIRFGNIPDCTKAGRLVFLNNISKTKAVVFTWQISSYREKVSPLWSTAFLPISIVPWKDLRAPFSTGHSVLGNWLSTRWWKKKWGQGLGQGTTGIQKGNLKTLVRLHEAGTTKCNKPQDSVHQQRPCLFLKYINCISLMPHTSEKERCAPCKEKAHRKVSQQWNSSSGFFSFFFFLNFVILPPRPYTQVLEIAPESGVAQPGESIPCFVTLQPTGNPSFCRINLVCEVRPKKYLCITMIWACYCGSQMADPSCQLPAASSWRNPSLIHTSHSWRHLASSFLML